jgi:hypothetical protein
MQLLGSRTAPIGTAWLVVAAIIIGRFGEAVVPTDYLIRPLIVGTGAALIVGFVASKTGRLGPLLAALGALLTMNANVTMLLGATAAMVVWKLYDMRWGRVDLVRTVPALSLAFAIVASVGAIPHIRLWPGNHRGGGVNGAPIYLVLLDAYPRADTLARWGIDVEPFIAELKARGFDNYPEATSRHRWTYRTLTAVLAGSSEDVPDTLSFGAERRQVHDGLVVPNSFVTIPPPIGMVAMAGPSLHVDSVTDFEANLLGESLVGMLAPDWGRTFITDSLLARVGQSLEVLASTDERRVFAHVIAPHTPLPGGPTCWPRCQIFTHDAAQLGMTDEEWWTRMGDRIHQLNAEILVAIDRILARRPDAVIVLFSDHGSRYSLADADEWYRSLLVARTPGHPALFHDNAHPEAVLSTVMDTYP